MIEIPQSTDEQIDLLHAFATSPERVAKETDTFAALRWRLERDEVQMTSSQRENALNAFGLLQVQQQYPDTWRGLSMGHLGQQYRWWYMAELAQAPQPINPAIWDWLTQPPTKAKKLWNDTAKASHAKAHIMASANRDMGEPLTDEMANRLKLAFMRDLIDESYSERNGMQPVVGPFTLLPPAIRKVEEMGVLKLFIAPTGIFCSMWRIGPTTPQIFYFDPNQRWENYPRYRMMLDVYLVLAGVWRDACVVQHQLYAERKREPYKPQTTTGKRANHKSALQLPRKVPIVEYDADEKEREIITRASHAVRAHYRWLYRPASEDARQSAEMRADEHGFPAPPKGYTFVSPHLRGNKDGDLPEDYVVYAPPKKVACRGLQVLKTLLD